MPHPAATVRPATPADAGEIVRLREVMFRAIHDYVDDGEWKPSAESQLRERLGRDVDAAVFVVDHPDERGRLIASGAGFITRRLPGPGNPSGLVGFVQSMVTEEGFRGRGIAHGVFTELMRWFAGHDIRRVALHASSAGAPIYRDFGFTDGEQPELVWRAPQESSPSR